MKWVLMIHLQCELEEIRLFGLRCIIVHTFLSLQIQLQGGAEDGHQNKGRVSPFSDPLQWLLDAFVAFDLDL